MRSVLFLRNTYILYLVSPHHNIKCNLVSLVTAEERPRETYQVSDRTLS